MIKQQLRTGNVLEEQILSLYDEIPRHEFVPPKYESFAYSDAQIDLGNGQRMMTPLEEGLLLQSLNLKGHETVLEIGTGTGFLTAMLSRLCKHVISVEYYDTFTAHAEQRLQKLGCKNVTLHTGDASQGWFDSAPFDVILITSGIESITESIRLQVLPGGKLFAIVGQAPTMKAQLHHLTHTEIWSHETVYETCLPPLINKIKTTGFVF